MKAKKALAFLLSVVMILGLVPMAALAASSESDGVYVLMNIPYADFYQAELPEGSAAVDAVSSATHNKPRTSALAGGSYHTQADGSDISGIIYPVYVEDPSVLESLREITDADSVEITVTNRGQTTTSTYTGAEALFEADHYAWYKLAETPVLYKTLSVDGDGMHFSAVTGAEPETVEGVTGSVIYNAKHADIEVKLSGLQEADVVSAVLVTGADGGVYGLRHIANLWRGQEIGWRADEAMAALEGSSIVNLRFITRDAVIDYPVDIAVEQRGTAGFLDVAEDAWYAEELTWAVEAGVVSNRGNGIFDADADLTRAEFVTYLYNAAGAPAPTSESSPFTDVSDSDSFYKAVLWATENGVTSGTSETTFSPERTMDRAQLVAFLWKKAGTPAPADEAMPFSDVPEGTWYYTPVLWAAQKGVTEGMGDSQFEPKTTVSRAQAVSFLYKNAIAVTGDYGVLAEIAGEDGATIVSLFDEIIGGEYDQIWADYVAAVVGTEAAEETAAGLQASITAEIYGQEAIDAYGDMSQGYAFNCSFINDVASFTFKDDTITTTLTDGSSQTHQYEYLGKDYIGEDETINYMGQEYPMASEVEVYHSLDEAGEFNYFLMKPDTMAETYHLEFRYGSDLDELKGYMKGPYAFWLAAGIEKDADAKTRENVIALFCLENSDCTTHTDAALEQLSTLGFVGTWKADLSAYGDTYANVDLQFTLDEKGHGLTTMNGETTADFEAFVTDNGEAGDGQGLYIAFSNLDGELSWAHYTMETDSDGQVILHLFSDEGDISYIRAD